MQNEIILSHDTEANDVINNSGKVHLRIKQRNGRKSITTIEGLAVNINLQTLLKNMRQTFQCGGSIQEIENEKCIQLFGDQRMLAKKFLSDNFIIEESNIIIHGY